MTDLSLRSDPARPDDVRRPLVRRLPLATVGWHLLALGSGLGACALALPENRRPALVLAGLGAMGLVAALMTAWRVVGSLAVALVVSAPLMDGAIEPGAAEPGRLVAATVLVTVLVVALDGVERRGAVRRATLHPAPWRQRVVTPTVALGGALALGAATTAPVAPSVSLVLLGLVAGVAALVLATRLH